MEHCSIVFHFMAAWLPWSSKGEGGGFLGLAIHVKIFLLSLLPSSSPLFTHLVLPQVQGSLYIR